MTMYLIDDPTRKLILREIGDLDDCRQKGRMTRQLQTRHDELRERLELDALARELESETRTREAIRSAWTAAKGRKATLEARIRSALDVPPAEMLSAAKDVVALDLELKGVSMAEAKLKNQLVEQTNLTNQLSDQCKQKYALVMRLSPARGGPSARYHG